MGCSEIEKEMDIEMCSWDKEIRISRCIHGNIGTTFVHLGLREDFMNLTPKIREVKTKINE